LALGRVGSGEEEIDDLRWGVYAGRGASEGCRECASGWRVQRVLLGAGVTVDELENLGPLLAKLRGLSQTSEADAVVEMVGEGRIQGRLRVAMGACND
jgi:hypothetical protein